MPRIYLECIFTFKHILVQAKNQSHFTLDTCFQKSVMMICKVCVSLIGRINQHIFHRLLTLKFVSKAQLYHFLWVIWNVVNAYLSMSTSPSERFIWTEDKHLQLPFLCPAQYLIVILGTSLFFNLRPSI